MTEETLASPTDEATEEHARSDRCIRDCCAGLREGYAEAWTEAESRHD